MYELLKRVAEWGGVPFVNNYIYYLTYDPTCQRVFGYRVWILLFPTCFVNIRGYQMLPVPMGTGSYPNLCPTNFLPTGTQIMDIHCHLYSYLTLAPW
jgi:hypothetical protein